MRLPLTAAVILLLLAAGAGLSSITVTPAFPKIEATDAGAGTLYLMGAAHVSGFNDTQWRTSLEVCNFSGITRSYQMGFLLRGQGNPDPETVELTLAPGLCVNYADVVATVFSPGEAVGTIRIEAGGDGVVATARTYNDTPDGTYGTALGTNAVDQAVAHGESTVLIHLAQSATDTDGYRTNLDLLNVTGIEITVEVALYSSDGTHYGKRSITLQPFEYAQKTKVFRWVTAQEVTDGYAVIRTTTTAGAFLTAASLVDNQTGDTTTIAGKRCAESERWLEAENLGQTINGAGDDWYPVLAKDGSFMIFISRGRGGYGSADIFISRFVGGEWQTPQNMGSNVNSNGFESAPFLSHDERTLYFTSNDQGITGSMDVWSCPLDDGVPGPKSKMPAINTSFIDCCPVLSADGNSMYICSDRSGGFGNLDVWVSNKVGGAWQTPVNLGETVNSYGIDSPRWISDDGNTLIIDSTRPGGFGGADLWYIVKSGAEWLAPVSLGSPVNSHAAEWGPGFLGNDGAISGRIFFGSSRPGGYGGLDIWYSDFGYPVAAKSIGVGDSGPVRIPNVIAIPRQAAGAASSNSGSPAPIGPVPPSRGCCSSEAD